MQSIDGEATGGLPAMGEDGRRQAPERHGGRGVAPASGTTAAGPAAGLCHGALVASGTELVRHLVPVVRAALDAGEPVVVNLTPVHLAALQLALGTYADAVTWSDTYQWLPHPVRRLRAFESLLGERRAARRGPSWWIGEFAWTGGPPGAIREWERFDALLDELLGGAQVRMLCVYDTDRLPGDVVGRAGMVHAQLGLAPVRASRTHLSCRRFLEATAPQELTVPDGAERAGERVRPAEGRAFLHRFAHGLLAGTELDELGVVVSELVTNSWRSGATSVELSCWTEDGSVVTQVDDDGAGITDPFAGYLAPPTDSPGGRGLWIARQLADLVEIAPRSPGTSVRARIASVAPPGR